ncbi:MAG: hypothetical protein IJS03_02685 [Eubacterium sp.]|nr:hypothetical protein [Eubacterium sp.]
MTIRCANLTFVRVIYDGKSNKDGEVILSKLPKREYTFFEAKAPNGVKLNTKNIISLLIRIATSKATVR